MNITETQRLLIKNWELSDADRLISIASKPNIQKWLPDWNNPNEWIANWIKMVNRHYIKNSPLTDFLSWAVVLKETSEIIGQINIGGDAFDNKEVEVAYFIDDEFTNFGYATEATKALVEYAFQTYGYPYIKAMVQPKNYASVATVKKVGFEYVETLDLQLDGHNHSDLFDIYRLDNHMV